jgi:hypothetical protein
MGFRLADPFANETVMRQFANQRVDLRRVCVVRASNCSVFVDRVLSHLKSKARRTEVSRRILKGIPHDRDQRLSSVPRNVVLDLHMITILSIL